MSRRKNKIDTTTLHKTHVARLSHEGRGITSVNGKNTFLFGGLPEEEVEFHYTAKHGRFDEGDVVNVTVSSPDRTQPLCEHFSLCGGCSFQHATHDLQIKHKQATLLEQLEHMGHLIVAPHQILEPVTGPLWGYRRKARLGVRYVAKKEKVLVGFRERQGHYLAELQHCKILDSKIGEHLLDLQALIQSLSVFEKIAQIEVAIDDTRAALVFRNLAPLTAEDESKLISFAKQHDFWIYLQPGNETSVYKLYPNDDAPLEYQVSYRGEIFRYHFHPLDFTQINAAINQKLITLALDLLDLKPTDQILDLFCGLGNFTLPLARHAGSVLGIEGSEAMIQRASHNAALNQITNANFQAMNLQASDLQVAHWPSRTFNKVLLDPPRTGAAEILREAHHWQAERIVYVSCNPATLARDAALLTEQGYMLTQTGIIDMFPHTAHVESIAIFLKTR